MCLPRVFLLIYEIACLHVIYLEHGITPQNFGLLTAEDMRLLCPHIGHRIQLEHKRNMIRPSVGASSLVQGPDPVNVFQKASTDVKVRFNLILRTMYLYLSCNAHSLTLHKHIFPDSYINIDSP